MSHAERDDGGLLGLIHSLGRLFRGDKPSSPDNDPEQKVSAGLAKLEVDFAQAITAMKERVENQRRAGGMAASGPAFIDLSAQDRAAERQQRKESCHRAMREDIDTMHSTLGTGLKDSDLEDVVAFLRELEALSHAGQDSHALVPRARHAIIERLRIEAGQLALENLISALRRSGLDWPEQPQHSPSMTPEELESSQRRRLSDTRTSFLTYDLTRIAERLQGIVSGWGADYPDRGSPLWQESVLKGVAAALWGRLIETFVELLEKDRELLVTRTERFMGTELAALHAALENRAGSIAETTDAVARALRVLDEVVPEIAWELVRPRFSELANQAPLREPEPLPSI